MDRLQAAQIKEMLYYVADAVIDAKPLLTEVDSAVGDGDHGIGMEVGFKKAKEKLSESDTNDVYEIFRLVGKAMLMSMGGASGVIFGSMFLEGAKRQEPADSISAYEFALLFRHSLLAIQNRGKAQVGDKTMVDALAPAVEAMDETAPQGFSAMLDSAERAAKGGVERTKNYEAKFGRSKTQSTTIGYQDAGATSVWVIFKAMNDYIQRQK